MKIFKSRAGTLAAKFDGVKYFTNVGGTYISPRLILPDQGSPLEADDWSIYPSAKTGLVGCPARLEGDALVIESPYGDLRFIPDTKINSSDLRFVRADANWVSVERTPHCYAEFVDFWKRFATYTDTSRVIY